MPLTLTLHCPIADHQAMVNNFQAAMSKLSTLGQTGNNLIDCSDVIPVPIAAKFTATLPPGKTMADIDRSGVRKHLISRCTLADVPVFELVRKLPLPKLGYSTRSSHICPPRVSTPLMSDVSRPRFTHFSLLFSTQHGLNAFTISTPLGFLIVMWLGASAVHSLEMHRGFFERIARPWCYPFLYRYPLCLYTYVVPSPTGDVVAL